jgi:peptidoglycan/LPS O-acetylase OafA/YrhL
MQTKTKFQQLIRNVSLRTNIKKIFNTNTDHTSQLSCLHAIRFLSLAWVVLGHSCLFMVMSSDNLAEVGNLLKNFWFQIVTNGLFSVDSFFLLRYSMNNNFFLKSHFKFLFIISGLLTSYTFLNELGRRNGKLSLGLLFKYYFHRYFRLTPPYVIVLLVSVYLTKYLGSGPFFPMIGFENAKCRTQWWLNMLYVNNFKNMSEMVNLIVHYRQLN